MVLKYYFIFLSPPRALVGHTIPIARLPILCHGLSLSLSVVFLWSLCGLPLLPTSDAYPHRGHVIWFPLPSERSRQGPGIENDIHQMKTKCELCVHSLENPSFFRRLLIARNNSTWDPYMRFSLWSSYGLSVVSLFCPKVTRIPTGVM